MSAPPWIILPVLALVIAAAASDLRTRRIPNALTGPAALLGLASHWAIGGHPEGLSSLTGLLVAGALLMPAGLMGWMGAGDVKLVAAVGAWLAYPQAVIAVLVACVAGGVCAAVVAARHGLLKQAFVGAAWMGAWTLSGWRRVGIPPPATSGIRFPFGLAVAAGAIFALWIRT